MPASIELKEIVSLMKNTDKESFIGALTRIIHAIPFV